MQAFAYSVLLIALAVPAFAQEGTGATPTTSRPYRGLFGSGMTGTTQSLNLNASLGGGYDDNALRDAAEGLEHGSDWNQSYQSTLGYASVGIMYSLNLERVTLSASGTSMGRYYPQLRDTVFRRDSIGMSGSIALSKSLSLTGFASYQPYSLSSLFPEMNLPEGNEGNDPGVLTATSFESSFVHFRSYGGGAEFTTELGRRTTLNAGYDYRRSDAPSGSRGFDGQALRAGFEHKITQHVSLGLDYRYRQAEYGLNAEPLRHHDIDGGLNYRRDFSLLRSRRTLISFSTGTSLTSGARTAEPGQSSSDPSTTDNGGIRFRVNGNALLRHELGRTWSSSLRYQRGVTLSHELLQPVYSDAVTLGLEGLITRRARFMANARAATGSVGAADDEGGFDSYAASTELSFFISRNISSGVNYTYYKYDFDDARLLAPGFAPGLGRKSVRAYVTVWAPLFSRARRP